jgi:hypothetical protein
MYNVLRIEDALMFTPTPVETKKTHTINTRDTSPFKILILWHMSPKVGDLFSHSETAEFDPKKRRSKHSLQSFKQENFSDPNFETFLPLDLSMVYILLHTSEAYKNLN